MTILFHPKKNIGRKVEMIGKTFAISSVLRDMKSFRVEEEKFGVVHDYTLVDVESAQVLTVSLNDGESWIDLPVYKA